MSDFLTAARLVHEAGTGARRSPRPDPVTHLVGGRRDLDRTICCYVSTFDIPEQDSFEFDKTDVTCPRLIKLGTTVYAYAPDGARDQLGRVVEVRMGAAGWPAYTVRWFRDGDGAYPTGWRQTRYRWQVLTELDDFALLASSCLLDCGT